MMLCSLARKEVGHVESGVHTVLSADGGTRRLFLAFGGASLRQ